MKIVSNCTLLAAALSAAYRTYNEYQPVDNNRSLEHFLDNNGVLVTMCMRFNGRIPWLECSRAKNDSRLSASWVQANKTRGFRVIGKPVDLGPPVGLVLKPSSTTIRCVYPMDAGTVGRDNNGCGPVAYDPHYGSKGYDHLGWFGKFMLREQLFDYKNNKFGSNRTWESIPCSEFFDPMQVSSLVIGLLENSDAKSPKNDQYYNWSYQSLEALAIDRWTYTMGHPICNQSQPPPKPNFNGSSSFFVYQSPTVFHSEDWPTIVKLFEDTVDLFPWVEDLNELVLDVPASENDFFHQSVQAVFYISGRGIVADAFARILAVREAKKWQKPLLYINLPSGAESGEQQDGSLFHCANEKEIDDDEGVATRGGKMLRKPSSAITNE